MRVLVLGSGAREHAVTWKFSKSHRISGLYIAPGNAGTDELGENLPEVDPENAIQVEEVCRDKNINLVFIGPEAPLAAGVADVLRKKGIAVFGPGAKAAELEASKVFSKNFMLRHAIPTAAAETVKSLAELENHLEHLKGRVVLKQNGLAAGKGVFESSDREALYSFGKKVLEKDSLLAEEFLQGYEISIFCLTDGKDYVVLPTCADFKKAGSGDSGPNTGGMGAICPVPGVGSSLLETVHKKIIAPTFRGMQEENLMYSGVLYFGLMVTDQGPRLLEYNVRFGDPETQVLIPLLESDFGNLTEAACIGRLKDFPLQVSSNYALGVVVASQGYPEAYAKDIPVKPIPIFPEQDALVFHASTHRKGETVLTGGGRCFTAVGLGPTLLNANVRAYEAVSRISFQGAWFRDDIGKKFFFDEEG
ncbi:MAG: phosphoribosylamine--glycine ligase [Spirochaetales bacterium]|nr:phosphoribosylamine--glycine ligase [Spirochaetales bacterium]